MNTLNVKTSEIYRISQENLQNNYINHFSVACQQNDIKNAQLLLPICLSFIEFSQINKISTPIFKYASSELLEFVSEKYPFLLTQKNGQCLFDIIQYGNIQALQYLQHQSTLIVSSRHTFSTILESDKSSSHFLLHAVMYQQFHIADYFLEQGWKTSSISLCLLEKYLTTILTFEEFLHSPEKIYPPISYLYLNAEDPELMISHLQNLNYPHTQYLLNQILFNHKLCKELKTKETIQGNKI